MNKTEASGKVLVLSDSHGDVNQMIEIIAHWEADISAVIFLGDGAADITEAAFIFTDLDFYAVTGNNDFSLIPNSRVQFPLENVITISGITIYMTHGHITHYKNVQAEVFQRAKSHKATIGLYGHLHVPAVEMQESVTIFNPGSIRYPREGSKSGYLILELDKEEIGYQFYEAQTHTYLSVIHKKTSEILTEI